MAKFQSTRPIRGATFWKNSFFTVTGISIHAPHTGRDFDVTTASPTQNNFNPRAPYGARRVKEEEIFLIIDISIHAPHTGRDAEVEKLRAELKISIHAPHTGRDQGRSRWRPCSRRFQSTRPIRGAT